MSWFLPFVIAHRGAPKLAPENTLSALRLAKASGATAVECDIQLTKDGIPVILHDASLSRTTNLNGLLSQKNFSAVRSASAGAWFSAQFLAEKIPTLQEWLETASSLDLTLNLEIKARTEKQSQLLALLVCAAISNHYAKHLPKPLISSSHFSVLQHIHNHDKHLQTGFIFERPASKQMCDVFAKQRIVSLHQPYQLMSERYIEKLHANNLRALAYTVNDPLEAATLKRNGVDGIFTDNHDLHR